MAESRPMPLVDTEEREHFLVMLEGPQPGRRVRLGSAPMLIGRNAACNLVVPDSEVSSRHCEVSAKPREAHAVVLDLQSTNGSFVEGIRVRGSGRLPHGGLLQIGRLVFRHEAFSKGEFAKAQELDRDLEKAKRYVQSLLPAPITSGPVRTDWFFLPSTQLGGDAFGYHQLGESTFAGYLIDVSGHGVGAAMHSVSVMNVLRQRALPDTDFHDPAQVLRSLNAMFQMDSHDGMYFSMWYGVYDTRSRSLHYASAGHHPAFLAHGDGTLHALQTRNLVIGAMPGARFVGARTQVAPGATLYVFSDGVFEIETRQGTQWALPSLLPLLAAPRGAGGNKSEQIYQKVRDIARPGPLGDDFSMLTITFV